MLTRMLRQDEIEALHKEVVKQNRTHYDKLRIQCISAKLWLDSMAQRYLSIVDIETLKSAIVPVPILLDEIERLTRENEILRNDVTVYTSMIKENYNMADESHFALET